MAHTPGPWKIDSDGFIYPVTEYEECGSHRCWWNNEKDKSLVCAAPELLEALERMDAYVESLILDGVMSSGEALNACIPIIKKNEGVVAQTRAVIRKAKGEA